VDTSLCSGIRKNTAVTGKGERTRAIILDTALELFVERGFDATTMREIAERAGVSLGSAYYYFESKEHLIQALYARTHQEHLAACQEVLARERDLEPRLRGVMRAKIDTLRPYHRFAGVLFRTAADPASPLNPFSDASQPVRQQATHLFATVLDGQLPRAPAELRSALPQLLWTYHMGVVLYWIHDDSLDCAKSYRLAERSAAIVSQLIRLSSLALLRPLVRRVLELTAELGDARPAAEPTT
jgi:AcrR family transcriptional regulator